MGSYRHYPDGCRIEVERSRHQSMNHAGFTRDTVMTRQNRKLKLSNVIKKYCNERTRRRKSYRDVYLGINLENKLGAVKRNRNRWSDKKEWHYYVAHHVATLCGAT